MVISEIEASELASSNSIEKFNMYGFLLVRGLFSTEITKKIILEAKSLSREDWETQKGGRSTFLKSSNHSKNDFSGVTYAQPITSYLNTARELMGCELLNGTNHLLKINDAFYKDAEMHVRQSLSNHLIPAHQDNFYFALENPSVLTCYIYLTPQTRSHGALGFFPTKIPTPTLDHEPGLVEGFSSFHPDMESKSDEFVYPSTQPGDVIFHHGTTFHRADPNKTQDTVTSISIRVFSRACVNKDPKIQEKYGENLRNNRQN